jgi:O-antigen ligase
LQLFNSGVFRKQKKHIVIGLSFHKIFVYFFSLLLLLFTALAAYTQQIFFAFIPAAMVLLLWLIQHPQYLFYLLLASIPWSVEYNFTATLGTDLPDEPLMLLASFAALVLFVYKKKSFAFKKLHPLLFLLMIQFIWSLITVVLSTDIVVSAKYLLAKAWYLLAFVAIPVFIWKDEKNIKRSAIVLTGSMLLLMLFGLAKHGQYNWSFEKVNEALEPFFRNHVNYSALLVCMVPLLIAFIQNTMSKSIRYFLTGVLLITIAALYFSYARGAWLALAAGVIAYWLLKKNLLLLGFLLFIFLCIGGVFWLKNNDRYLQFSNDFKSTIYHKTFREHLTATYQLKDLSTAERYYRWIAGVRMAKDSWQTGFGPNTFYNNYKAYTVPAFKTWVSKNEEHSTVHNYFLLLLLEQGAAGLILFLLLLASLFWYAQTIYHRTKDKLWRITTAAVASILTMLCTVNFLSDLIETDKVGSIFYLCVALLITADIKTRLRENNSEESKSE